MSLARTVLIYGSVQKCQAAWLPVMQCSTNIKQVKLHQQFIDKCIIFKCLQIMWANIMSSGVCFKKLHLIKVGTFAWYSVKIHINVSIQFERRKVDKKANLHENWNMQSPF